MSGGVYYEANIYHLSQYRIVIDIKIQNLYQKH
jgi:hypothetical protein